MYLEELKNLLEYKISPKLFKLNSEFYGFQYGQTSKNKLIKKVMITLDLSLKAIHFAIKNKTNLIISYHSLTNKPIKSFNSHIINKLSLLSKYPVLIFVLNSSYIAAEGGVSDTLMDLLYLKLDKPFNVTNKKGVEVPIGRVCTPLYYQNEKDILTLENLLKRIKHNLDLNQILYVGDLKNIINKICIVGGNMSKTRYLEKALTHGCDCYISGKINHLGALYAKDMGLNLIEASNYEAEKITLKKLCNVLSLEFPRDEFFLFESGELISTYS